MESRSINASRIALIITWTFTGALAVSLVGILALLIADRHDPAVVKVLLEAGIPAFKEVCIALTSLFGPLLAFVLGYYLVRRTKRADLQPFKLGEFFDQLFYAVPCKGYRNLGVVAVAFAADDRAFAVFGVAHTLVFS